MASEVSRESEPPAQRLARLKDYANSFNMDVRQPIRRYYHSGHQMLKMGDTYYREGNYENAYILYLKFLTLFIEKIKKHPEYKTFPVVQREKILCHLKPVLERSEALKTRLTDQYDKEHQTWLRAEAARRAQEQEKKGKLLREQLGQYQEEKDRTIALQKDYEAALLNQFQWDKEEAIKRNKETDHDVGGEQEKKDIPNQNEIDRSTKPSAPLATSLYPPAIPDRSQKPSLTSSSYGLRQLIIPEAVMKQFLSLAAENTSRNVETCAILGGKLARDNLIITHVLVPKQKGTPDSCTMTNDDEMFDYQLSHDLLTLGWIHTHPSQTAFLSSVDLHNHYGYQVMMPEAVAIVCSPKYNETGFFVLTQEYGLDYIGNCQEKGFHPHPKEPPLFEEGRHITLDGSRNVKLIDMR